MTYNKDKKFVNVNIKIPTDLHFDFNSVIPNTMTQEEAILNSMIVTMNYINAGVIRFVPRKDNKRKSKMEMKK